MQSMAAVPEAWKYLHCVLKEGELKHCTYEEVEIHYLEMWSYL
jgi:hypothetical protein